MISSRASNVVALLQRYDQFRKDLKLNEQLKSRADELKAAADSLEEPAKRVALQREREWIKESQLPSTDVEKLQTAIAKIRELIPEDPAKIDTPVNRLVEGCESVADKAARQTEVEWAEVVKRRRPAVDEADLKRCEQFNSESATVEEIRRLTRIPVTRVPTDLNALHEIEKRWDQLRTLIGSLPKGSENPDVNRFLDAVRKGGAPLDLLTESVRQYLEDTGKTKAFRIYQDR
ncbi:MAG: hypothetical protein O3A00_25490 [Planctomycetota bacterium]|nr:hypothetical protein [Planctomycetota bacterium]